MKRRRLPASWIADFREAHLYFIVREAILRRWTTGAVTPKLRDIEYAALRRWHSHLTMRQAHIVRELARRDMERGGYYLAN